MSAHEHLSHEHLNDDALLDALYGLASHEPHLRECPVCAGRVSEWRRKRESLADAADVGADVSSEFLAAQRRKIYERLEQPQPKRLRWAPALAMACLVAVGVLVYHPATPPAPQQHGDVSDSQLFSDAYSMDQSLEPSAAAPIHALFEGGN
jgi:anti-sigma factor RsiW